MTLTWCARSSAMEGSSSSRERMSRRSGGDFLQDADAAIQSEAWDRVTIQSTAVFATPVSCAGWHGVDSTYIVCQVDRSTSVVLQRVHAVRAQRFVELAPGHHPFVPRPDLVVDQLELLL